MLQPIDGFCSVRNRLASKHRIDCRAQIFPGHGDSIARTAVIVLPAIDELEIGVEKIWIGRACGVVRVGHAAILVI